MHRALAPLLALALAPAAAAQIFVAGYTFADDAGPDVVVPVPGSQHGFASPATACLAVDGTLPGMTLQQSLGAVFGDADLDEWVFYRSRTRLEFTDNLVLNGPGADLVVFEIGGAEAFALQVLTESICEWSAPKNYSPAATGFVSNPCGGAGNAVNAREIDLSDFGVLPGAGVRRLLIDNLGSPGGSVGADLALVMALNSASVPAGAPGCLRSFQQGVDAGTGAYSGAADTAIAADFPANNYAAAPLEYVDATPEHSLLLRFDGLVGNGPGQVPAGATVAKATLSIFSGPTSGDNSSGTHAVHRLLQPWNAATLTFANGFGGDGIDANGTEATAAAVASVGGMAVSTSQELDVTAAVQAWVDGAPNHGLAFLTASADALGLQLAEAANVAARPALTVHLTGAIGYADAVASFDPVIGGSGPLACMLDAQNALGAPDYVDQGPECCPPIVMLTTLGVGGSITLEFQDISIAGNGSPEPDLWIYERGPDVEDTYVELSEDGLVFEDAGKVFGAVSAVDLDALGFGPTQLFRYIRLTDDPLEGDTTGCTVGADIDAVAALAPNPWLNLGSALAGLNGAPKLGAAGALAPAGALQLAITNGLPFGSASMVLGVGVLDAPFKGGTMVPQLTLLVPGLPLGPAGSLVLPATWPAGVPSGVPIVMQAWIADAGGPKGFAATNGIMTLTQ